MAVTMSTAPGTLARAEAALSRAVPAQSLAAFRIALGALLVWDCWRFVRDDRIRRYWVDPEVYFSYPGFAWVAPLPEPWIHLAWLALGGAAALVMLGLFYRIAVVVLTLLFTYFFLLDRAQYLNHFYLVILFLCLMCALPAHRALSLDTWRRGTGGQVPYAAVFLLRAQMEVVLVFAGLVKLTPDWLRGEPLGLWLRPQAGTFPFGSLLLHDWVILAGSWGTVALHLAGAPLLLFRRTRLAAFCAYGAFHALNAAFFNIGIFPWLAIAATTVFFAPDWPRQVAARLLGRRPGGTLPVNSTPRLPAAALCAMALWLGVQVALPLRAALFPTEVRWTGEGHEFSWRMRLYDREAEGAFRVTAADGTEWLVEPEEFLTPRQAHRMLTRPDLIHQFAAHLEGVWRRAGWGDVAVTADIVKSLNGRPMQRFVDPDADLTALPFRRFGSDTWVLPMEIPVWGIAQNREQPRLVLPYADPGALARHFDGSSGEDTPVAPIIVSGAKRNGIPHLPEPGAGRRL